MKRIALPFALILALVFTSSAQDDEESIRGPGRFGGSERLAAAGLTIGQSLPPLAVYDDAGRPFDVMSQLQGHYAVIVFGCLT